MRHLLLWGLFLSQNAQAWVYMPDPALRAWAESNYPGCINGQYIDEMHPGVQGAYMIDISGVGTVTNLMGTEAFANASFMDVSNNPITTWYGPQSLQTLFANNCGITGTFTVPLPLTTVNVSYNNISTLDLTAANNLQTVRAHHNQITTVQWGSPNLFEIDLSYNQLSSMGSGFHAPFLNTLDISHNQFTALPSMWSTWWTLDASWNQITDISTIGAADHLSADLSHNQIDHVASLGKASDVNLSFNPLAQGIDETSYYMHTLRVNDTQLPCLPYLHNSLVNLYCTSSPVNCLPNQPSGLVMDQARFGFPPAVCSSSSACYEPLPRLDLKVFLQGPFDASTNTMRDDLRVQALIPSTDPYPALGFTYAGNGWSDEFDPDVLETTGDMAIVDWVIVDMMVNGVPQPNDAKHYSRPALVTRNGQVVGLDGSWPLVMNTTRGIYRIAVRHRNHLGVITRDFQAIYDTLRVIDFTLYSATACYHEAMHGDSLLADERQLWAGDVTFDQLIKYTGTDNDRDPILQAIGGTIPSQVLSGVYHQADVNMDGVVKYTGPDNDRDLILQNLESGSNPTATRQQVGFQ